MQAPVQAPAAISAPAPAPIPGHYTMEQALAVINGKEKELELSAIVKSLDEIPNAAGAMAGAAQASNEFDIKVALAQYKAKPIDPSVRERVSKGLPPIAQCEIAVFLRHRLSAIPNATTPRLQLTEWQGSLPPQGMRPPPFRSSEQNGGRGPA